MTVQARTKKIVALILVAVLVVGVAFGIVMWNLIRNAPEHEPTITAYGGGHTIEVAPIFRCEDDMSDAPDCLQTARDADVPVLRLRPGQTVQMSLPSQISDRLWRLVVTVGDVGTGQLQAFEQFYRPGKTNVTIPSNDNTVIVGVEVQIPSIVTDEQGLPFVSGSWGFQTDPILDSPAPAEGP